MTFRRKLCVITGSRSDYGLLKHLIKSISNSDLFQLQLIATGSHLSEKFGKTYLEIEADGFYIDKKIDIDVKGGSPSETISSTALSLTSFSDALIDLHPDLVIMLGDRYELLGAAIACMVHNVPIAHFHGGESTYGAIDEAIRHALTKFSHIHFVATEEYRKRVVQLGETPARVHNVGGLGVDAINRMHLLSRTELECDLGIKLKEKNLLITFHPVTLDQQSSSLQIQELLDALEDHREKCLIFTMPNADTGGMAIYDLIKNYVARHDNAYLFSSLGQLRYFSCIAQVDGVIGNSSSGLLEVPTFKKPTINIGDRQKGRLRAESVIDCPPIRSQISDAIFRIYESDFRLKLNATKNPYGDGLAVEKVLSILARLSFDGLLKKEFYDLPI